jgi:hypothetical protein
MFVKHKLTPKYQSPRTYHSKPIGKGKVFGKLQNDTGTSKLLDLVHELIDSINKMLKTIAE